MSYEQKGKGKSGDRIYEIIDMLKKLASKIRKGKQGKNLKYKRTLKMRKDSKKLRKRYQI